MKFYFKGRTIVQVDVENLKVVNNTDVNRFEIQLPGDQVAEIDYLQEGDVIVMVHTGVPKEFSGQGIADKLTHDALEYVKAEGYRVMALCPFVSAYIRRHPEYKDITVSTPG
jgi:predicted GNAT family acetyltransferase